MNEVVLLKLLNGLLLGGVGATGINENGRIFSLRHGFRLWLGLGLLFELIQYWPDLTLVDIRMALVE